MCNNIYYELRFDHARCVGCGACVTACMDTNFSLWEAAVPLRRVTRREMLRDREPRILYYSQACRHCAAPPCSLACPRKCLVRDPHQGIVVLDHTNCAGCGACAAACSESFIEMSNGQPHKCLGCFADGTVPACAQACSRQALNITDPDAPHISGGELPTPDLEINYI